MDAIVVLDLRDLEKGIPALTKALGQVHAESAAVCLEDQGHLGSVSLHVRKIDAPEFMLRWPHVTDTMRRAYNDLQNATENGACGIALLLLRNLTDLTAIRASRKGTGFDYWLAPEADSDKLVFQNAARLEVSGILSGTDSQFATRLKQKLRQSEVSDDTRLPAYAVVVEFGQPQAEVAER